MGIGSRDDGVAFARFYRAQYAPLVAFFLRRVDDRELARDLAAEAFRIAWSKHGPLTRAWLYGVARNLVGDEWRRRARQGPHADLPDDLPAADRQRDADVRLVLGGMPPQDREVLVLTYWDGLSAGEIGTVLGISRPAVWTRLHRARVAFADAWRDAPSPYRRPSEEPA